MSKKEHSSKENLELVKEHVKIAEDLILEESEKCEDPNSCKPEEVRTLKEAAFTLEKTESKIEDLEKIDYSEDN